MCGRASPKAWITFISDHTTKEKLLFLPQHLSTVKNGSARIWGLGILSPLHVEVFNWLGLM